MEIYRLQNYLNNSLRDRERVIWKSGIQLEKEQTESGSKASWSNIRLFSIKVKLRNGVIFPIALNRLKLISIG